MSDFNNIDLQSHFDENGYIAINPLFSDNKIEEIKIELTRYIKEVAPKVPDHHVFYENKDDKSTIKQLQQMFTYDDYFKDLIGLKKNGVSTHVQILDSYLKKTVGYYEFGWFCSDVMLKLGLIGTVIGFIIMLSSLSDITTFDVTLLQGVLTTMGSGMGVALYTTLSALVTGVLIAIQYYNLESGCEELFAVLNQISEVSIDSSL